MRKQLPVVVAYLALLLLSLAIPLLHQRLTDQAIESMRPVMKLSDGSLSTGLMPAEILLLRWLGQISWFVVCGVFVCFVLSFWCDALSRFTIICTLAIGQCAFTTFYAFYATALLGLSWLHPGG